MPDELSQAANSQASEPAQVPESTTEQVSTQPETQQEKPLTLEDVRRLAREEATRIAQSQVAKGENRINQRIQEQFGALDKSKGVLNLSDEQVAQAKQKIVTDAYSEPEPQASTPTQQPESEAQLHPAVALAYSHMDKRQTAINPDDPEFKQFIAPELEKGPQGLDAGDLLLATDKAIEAKKARVEANKEKAPLRAANSGGGSSGETPAKSASEYWDKAYK